MAEFDWKKLVGGIALTLGTALGGPLADMALKVLADAVLVTPQRLRRMSPRRCRPANSPASRWSP